MLLIDLLKEGLIVDVNQVVICFYGYLWDEMCRKYIWEINSMGKDVLFVMNEVVKLLGGYKLFNFIYKLVDGNICYV